MEMMRAMVLSECKKIEEKPLKLTNIQRHSISNSDEYTQPVFIHYPVSYPDNNENDKKICWADKRQSLIKIALKCMSKLRTDVIIKFHTPIKCDQDAYTLAKRSFELVKASRDEMTADN